MSSPTLLLGRRARLVGTAVATTPGLLKTALAANCTLALLFACVVAAGVRGHRQGMQTIGKDSAPSIIAALRIRSSLADMDSNLANGLIGGPGEHPEATRAYESRRLEVTEGLLAAAGNITYGDAERVPIRTLINGLGPYEEAAARARVLHERGDHGFLVELRAADRVMDETLLPAAEALDRANRAALDLGYATRRATSWRTLLGVTLAGTLLIGCLVATQVLLHLRMRRMLNPPLLVATAIAVGFLLYTVAAFTTEARLLKVAKQDAFESIHALWHARAFAYDANGDESRWLIDRPQAAVHEKAFFDKTARLVERPDRLSLDGLVAQVVAGPLPDGFQGYLAAELRNITFPGEREAAVEMLKTFARYVALDGEIRRLENQGDHRAAVALCIGYDPGQSNWAFARFDEALGKTIDINQRYFDTAVASGFHTLAGFDRSTPFVALVVALLAYIGLRPRMREYAG